MYGKIIVQRAGHKAHYEMPGVSILGIFTYNVLEDTLNYQRYKYGIEHIEKVKHGVIRGRVFNDNKKNIVILYTADLKRDLSGGIVEKIATKIEENVGVHYLYIVDEIGRDLRS